jgi:hypothetical protein
MPNFYGRADQPAFSLAPHAAVRRRRTAPDGKVHSRVGGALPRFLPSPGQGRQARSGPAGTVQSRGSGLKTALSRDLSKREETVRIGIRPGEPVDAATERDAQTHGNFALIVA